MNGCVNAFFTKKTPGSRIEEISSLFSIKEEHIFLPLQRHTDIVHVIGTELKENTADAVVTDKKGILIGVRVADCVPVLLFDRKSTVIGAVHAGWRGIAAEIIKKTIRTMSGYFGSLPEDIVAAIGPSIRWGCYPVGVEVLEAVCRATGEGKYFERQTDGTNYLDLSSASGIQLITTGVQEKNIWISNECTYCNPKDYYSYRYSGKFTGSQGGFIGII